MGDDLWRSFFAIFWRAFGMVGLFSLASRGQWGILALGVALSLLVTVTLKARRVDGPASERH
jgi:hypothetical protein